MAEHNVNRQLRNNSDQHETAGTREQLLSAAAALMTETSSTDFSLNDVGKRSGLNTALVKYYFGNKSGMMMALIKDIVTDSFVRLERLAKLDIPPEEKIEIHIKGYVALCHRFPFLCQLVNRMSQIEDGKYMGEIADDFIKPLIKVQKKILDEGIKAGKFRKIDPMLFYFQVSGACDALFHAKSVIESGFDVTNFDKGLRDDYAKQITKTLLEGISAK